MRNSFHCLLVGFQRRTVQQLESLSDLPFPVLPFRLSSTAHECDCDRRRDVQHYSTKLPTTKKLQAGNASCCKILGL